jgi:RNA polymerase sigma-70 factor (ECF subfamily)
MQPLDAVPEPPGQAGLGGAGLSPAESDAVERLERALRGLPVRQRIALVLRYQEGKSCAEIGEVLDMTPNAVSIQLYHARRTLRGLLAAEAPRSAP